MQITHQCESKLSNLIDKIIWRYISNFVLQYPTNIIKIACYPKYSVDILKMEQSYSPAGRV